MQVFVTVITVSCTHTYTAAIKSTIRSIESRDRWESTRADFARDSESEKNQMRIRWGGLQLECWGIVEIGSYWRRSFHTQLFAADFPRRGSRVFDRVLNRPMRGSIDLSRSGAKPRFILIIIRKRRAVLSGAGDVTTQWKRTLRLYDATIAVRPLRRTYRSTNGWRPLMRPWSVNNARYRTCLSDGDARVEWLLPSRIPASRVKGLSTWIINHLYESIYRQHRK